MNRQILTIAILVLTLVGLTAMSGGVLAAATDDKDSLSVEEIVAGLENAANPYKAFAKLTALEQEKVKEYLTATTVEVSNISTTSDVSAASSGCGVNSHTDTWRNLLGKVLFTYTTRTTWCWNGTEITNDPHFTKDAEVRMIFWEFVGHIESSESGGEGDWMHSDYAEGHFRLCITEIGCIQHAYPDVSKRQFSDGTSQAW